jgi:hypothetical protein
LLLDDLAGEVGHQRVKDVDAFSVHREEKRPLVGIPGPNESADWDPDERCFREYTDQFLARY